MIRKILSKIRHDCNIKKLIKDGMILGKNYSIARNAIIDYSHCWLIEIGDDVTITSGCTILAHDASCKKDLGYAKVGCVKIGNNVFIGVNSVILPNTIIGDNTIIGAGSVVHGVIEPDSVYIGSPARKVYTKTEFLNKHKKKIKEKKLVFEEEYTIRTNISAEKKAEMKEKLKNEMGYVR